MDIYTEEPEQPFILCCRVDLAGKVETQIPRSDPISDLTGPTQICLSPQHTDCTISVLDFIMHEGKGLALKPKTE